MRNAWLLIFWTLCALAAAAAPDRYLVTIPSDPPGAEVYYKGEPLGTTDHPVEVTFPADAAEVKLDLVRDGYVSTPLMLNRVAAMQQRVGVVTVLKPASWSVALRDAWRRYWWACLIGLLAVALLVGLRIREVRRHRRTSQENDRLQELQDQSPGDAWIGKLVGGYRLTRRVGKGGFGTVYQGVPQDSWDESRAVAVKIQEEPNEEDRRRLEREVSIVRGLKHRHIVPLLDWGEHDGALYVIYELVRGCTVRDRLEGGRGKSLDEAWVLLEPMLDAVEYAHRQRVVHRDLKPENMMLDEEGRLQVLDFGLARAESSQTITAQGDTRGTIPYMPPEQFFGEQAFNVEQFSRLDQYALGVIAYELLTGTLPFHDPDPLRLITKVLTEPVPPFGERGYPQHPAVEAVVMRMLEKDAGHRYADLGQVTAAWREALQRAKVPA